MNVDEYSALVNSLIDGLPLSLVISRLTLTLAAVCRDGGPPAQAALRTIVEGYRRRDEGAEDPPPTPPAPAPRRR